MAVVPRSRFIMTSAHSSAAASVATAPAAGGVATTSPPSTTVKPAVLFHPAVFNTSVSRKVFTPIISIPVNLNPPIPDASTKNGNLFNDRFDKSIRWYLPTFSLVPGIDAAFSFTAKQTALNESGDPFYVVDLKFTVHKDVPPEATAAKAADTSINLKEIPLDSLQVTLLLAYEDAQGTQHVNYTGTIQATSDGNYEVSFSNIKDHVVLLYENLKTTGGAQIALSATYSAWRPTGTPMLFFTRTAFAATAVKPAIAPTNFKIIRFPGQPPPKPTSGFNENQTFYQAISANKKYGENDYQLKYVINSDTGPRPIINADDLKNLKGSPTEFSELKTIDLTKYPSINALYIGVLSHAIVILPRTYGIVRNAVTCSASCWASVDSSPSGAGSCKFQFQFELTPAVDPIEFILLQKEIQQNADLKNYTLQFADSLSDKSPSTINSTFPTNTDYEPAATPQNFFLTTTIVDQPGQSAIANANLFIQQLCKTPPGCGIGVINLKLDDDFPNAVSSTVTLSLPNAISDDGIGWSIDTDSQTIKLTNSTSFNFLLQRYTIVSDQGIGDPVAANIAIASGGSTTVPLPSNFTHLTIVLDYIEQSSGPVDRTNIARYMEIKAQDAQNVQYLIGINSAQINYTSHNIKQIDVQVALNTLSTINVPSFSVMKQNTDWGSKVMLPLQFAVTSIPATISFSVSFLDAEKAALSFTKQNDFIINPIFDLVDADITT